MLSALAIAHQLLYKDIYLKGIQRYIFRELCASLLFEVRSPNTVVNWVFFFFLDAVYGILSCLLSTSGIGMKGEPPPFSTRVTHSR